jgi:metal-responsive CopG/Arc/MetJ family transcriptional regulator
VATKVKVTVSVEESLIRELAEASRKTGRPRSQLVEEALRLWRHSQVAEALKEGYLTMAKEDRETAERRLGVGWEVVR